MADDFWEVGMSVPDDPAAGGGKMHSDGARTVAGTAPGTDFTEVPHWVPLAIVLWVADAFAGPGAAVLVAVLGGAVWLLVGPLPSARWPVTDDRPAPADGSG